MKKVIWPRMAGVNIVPQLEKGRTVWAVVFFVSFIALDWLTYVFPARFGITPLNPEAAVAIAMLMFCGLRYIPAVYLAAAIGEYALPSVTRPLAVILINSGILTAGFAVVAILLTGRFNVSLALATRTDLMRLMCVTLVSMLICGIAYVGILILFGIGPEARYFNGARRFFIGYSAGILVVLPLLFMPMNEKRRAQFVAYFTSYEAWLQIAAIAACIWWVFLQKQSEHVRHFYALFLPLAWAAMRFGMPGAATGLALIQVGVFAAVYLSGYQPLSVFELQLLLIVLVITGLLLGVSIDEERRATENFRESLKLAAAGEMAAAIAHELNQPLTALSGYAVAGQLIAAAPDPDRKRLNETMIKLREESTRAAAVVRRLRDFFRTGATRLERISLDVLAAQVMDSVRVKANACKIALTLVNRGNIGLVLVDPVQIEVVLRNLLTNAVESAADAPAAGGHVEIEIQSSRPNEVTVSVRDSGPGVRAADMTRLFESFSSSKTSGMGMGLAISRAIVDAHGGRIWAVPGDCGLFCVTLPADAQTGGTNANAV